MIDELLRAKLEELDGERILVVMEDGLAFIGVLEDHGENTIVLSEVYQGSSTEINWENIEKDFEDVIGRKPKELQKKEVEGKKEYGFIDWLSINLDEVYLQSAHVSRIWPWRLTEESTEEEEKKPPVYHKLPDRPAVPYP